MQEISYLTSEGCPSEAHYGDFSVDS